MCGHDVTQCLSEGYLRLENSANPYTKQGFYGIII